MKKLILFLAVSTFILTSCTNKKEVVKNENEEIIEDNNVHIVEDTYEINILEVLSLLIEQIQL